jgi:hypothetical protein
LNLENPKEIYEKVVTHGPLDVKVYVGNLSPYFNDPESPDDLVREYFKTTTFCDGAKIFLGVNDLV